MAIGLVWLVAAAAKLASPAATRDSVRRLVGGPSWAVGLIAMGLPPAEAMMGALLLAGIMVQVVASLSTALFLIFSVLIGRAAVLDSLGGAGCGCFGRLAVAKSGAGSGPEVIARNLVLAVLALAVAGAG